LVTHGGGCEMIQLGATAAARGVLVGRYERCATSLIRDGGHDRVSRVHLLVIELDGALYALDTASTNGTLLGDQEVRLVRLQHGLRLGLGGDEVQVVWQVLN
jgi:pSer/pThr/pTyr-binding forkhead associated (FHA) protein